MMREMAKTISVEGGVLVSEPSPLFFFSSHNRRLGVQREFHGFFLKGHNAEFLNENVSRVAAIWSVVEIDG